MAFTIQQDEIAVAAHVAHALSTTNPLHEALANREMLGPYKHKGYQAVGKLTISTEDS